uniref:Papilin n=1 Tax=Scleropages formosus TaxID=113540 RepID=A0A8C9WC28_SCLFO
MSVYSRNDGGNSCVGPAKSYRSCNIQDCPEGSRDFREEQCAQFDGMDFQGKRYKWLPYYRAENPCELNCIPQGESFFYRHHPAVVDGTPCYPGRRDICVDGVCKRLGCDNILESPQEEDPCLQCGGNGQSCHLVQGTFAMRNVPSGYNQMFIIPVGATTIRIREMVPTRNYLAVKNLRGEYYLNGDWVIDYSRAAPIAGTTLYYQRGAEGDMAPESITGRGPTTEPLVIELISQEENQGVEYEYYISQSRAREGYFWSYGSWSECSKDCGSGYQSRLVFCAIDNEAYPDYLCSTLPRPLSNRTCNVQPCPQTRSWKMGEWSACSAPCGGGSQTRSVQCISHEGIGSRVVEDSICASYSSQPVSQQSCNLQPCPRYSVTRWSQCSVTCGTGEQTREVTCVGAGSLRLQEYSCSGLLLPQRVQPCQMPACPLQIAWHIGDWGLCSVSCGSGLRERQVICSDKERNLYGPERCAPHPKPVTVEVCNPQSCFSPQREFSSTLLLNISHVHYIVHPGCFLPHTAGPCSEWMSRYYYSQSAGKCVHFWYGGCHGNRNNFLSKEDCEKECHSVVRGQPRPVQVVQRRQPAHSRVRDMRRVFTQQPNGSLLVGPLTLQDSGWLLCVATRRRERDHRYIYLSVSGEPVSLVLVASQLLLVAACRHTQNSDGSLSIRQLSSEDSGVYTCTASSQYHTDQRQLQLKVQGDLKITTAPNNIQVTQGGTAQLPCVVTGDNVSVGWSRNGVPVRPDGHRVQVSPDGSLILNNVQPSDEGSYTCNAYTGTYSVSASAEVRVELGARESVSAECADQPELANCDLIVYARLCTNEYYSSFCCASCARHARA